MANDPPAGTTLKVAKQSSVSGWTHRAVCADVSPQAPHDRSLQPGLDDRGRARGRQIAVPPGRRDPGAINRAMNHALLSGSTHEGPSQVTGISALSSPRKRIGPLNAPIARSGSTSTPITRLGDPSAQCASAASNCRASASERSTRRWWSSFHQDGTAPRLRRRSSSALCKSFAAVLRF